MKTTIILAVCALLAGCASMETIQVLDAIVAVINHTPANK